MPAVAPISDFSRPPTLDVLHAQNANNAGCVPGEWNEVTSVGHGEGEVLNFSTHEFAEHERLPTWREEFGRRFVRVEIEPVSNEPFRAEATLRSWSGLRTVSFAGSSMSFNRTSAMAAEGDDSVGIVVSLSDVTTVSQRGKVATLRRGDAFPILTAEPAILTGTKHIGMLFPRAALGARVANIEDAASRPIPRDTEALRLLTTYMHYLPHDLGQKTPRLRRAIVNHLTDLVALAIAPPKAIGESGLSAVAASRLEAILACIERRYQEPDLSAAKIARSQGISPRYFHRLIETTGVSFTAQVNDLRLRCAFRHLTDPTATHLRISDIALQAGFSDISYFNRLFVARFGDVPSAIRHSARAAVRQ